MVLNDVQFIVLHPKKNVLDLLVKTSSEIVIIIPNRGWKRVIRR
jgi:hypothetical protein